jgi:hypothetical protein
MGSLMFSFIELTLKAPLGVWGWRVKWLLNIGRFKNRKPQKIIFVLNQSLKL